MIITDHYWEFSAEAYGTLCRARMHANRYQQSGAVALNMFVADDTTTMFRFYETVSFEVYNIGVFDVVFSPLIHEKTLQAVLESGIVDPDPYRKISVNIDDKTVQELDVYQFTEEGKMWYASHFDVLNYELNMFNVQEQ